jgi:hypothetical protein
MSLRNDKLRREREKLSDYTQTEEFVELTAYLTEELGVDQREAALCLRDGDLWPLIDAGSIYPFEGEEGIEMWAGAVDYFRGLMDCAQPDDNPAVTQCLSESVIRAQEMLKRARERVSEASVE